MCLVLVPCVVFHLSLTIKKHTLFSGRNVWNVLWIEEPTLSLSLSWHLYPFLFLFLSLSVYSLSPAFASIRDWSFLIRKRSRGMCEIGRDHIANWKVRMEWCKNGKHVKVEAQQWPLKYWCTVQMGIRHVFTVRHTLVLSGKKWTLFPNGKTKKEEEEDRE